VCLIGTGLSYMYWGTTKTLVTYTIAMTLVTCFINGAAYIGGNTLIATWFPKKKGLVNGITTMGHNLASALYVPLINALIVGCGFAGGMARAAIIPILVGVIGFFLIRNTPKEMGLYPDNVSKEVYDREYAGDVEEDNGGWTVKKLLKTKELWLCSLIIGINQLVTTGVMSQLVVRNTSLGLTQAQAVSLMTVCALIGLVGSFAFGAFDQKLGVKKAMIMYLVWYCLALAVNCTDTKVGVYISVAMIGVAIGAAANFIVSLPSSVFGRHGFNIVNSVFFPLMEVVLMMNYIVNAAALKMTGSLRGAYIVYICILVLNIVLISTLNVRKYNKDYAVEDELQR